MDIIRPYVSADRDGCLALFDGNVPDYFSASERPDFRTFLEQQISGESYQVIERDGRIVACGGHAVESDGVTASLCWGMVAHELHKAGLGTILTEARLNAARAAPGVTQVRLDTSQHTQAFYARFGFQTEAVTPDGYGSGLDRWDMMLRF